jgi:hypothetical protein
MAGHQERLKLQRPVGELMKQPVSENWNDTNNDFPIPFALVPWGQHIEIITRSESLYTKKSCKSFQSYEKTSKMQKESWLFFS